MSAKTAKKVIPIMDKTPGKRCSDYDEDCAHVQNHYACWIGGPYGFWGEIEHADGYCPYLIGMEG